jgi:3-methyl-2-oxobutanoate hydroxymethyltransferase
VPKHTKQYAQVAKVMSEAINGYYAEVKSGLFPTELQSFPIDESIIDELKKK